MKRANSLQLPFLLSVLSLLWASCSDDSASSEKPAGSEPSDAAVHLADAQSQTDATTADANPLADAGLADATTPAADATTDDAGPRPDATWCPEPFVPATAGPTNLDVVRDLSGGVLVATTPLAGNPTNLISALYNLELQLGKEYDLAQTAGQLRAPQLAAAYDFDAQTQGSKVTYVSTEGTLIFSEICADGVAGTVTGARFQQIMSAQDPTPVPNGCAMEVEAMEFHIGTCNQPTNQ